MCAYIGERGINEMFAFSSPLGFPSALLSQISAEPMALMRADKPAKQFQFSSLLPLRQPAPALGREEATVSVTQGTPCGKSTGAA